MTRKEQREYLIRALLSERGETAKLPQDENEQKRLLRALFNVRMPHPVSEEFLRVQDSYLRAETEEKGITYLSDLSPVEDGIYLWQGDITTLSCDAIVNAANSQMLGCFYPCHSCIDNAIHTFAGVQLRRDCAVLMRRQGHEEPTGSAKITPAYNLPCRYVIHTVGPIIGGRLTEEDCALLASCYRSCLQLAADSGLNSIAFCCISTGEFHFPNDIAAQIAAGTVRTFRETHDIKVIFNVFKDHDKQLYSELLGTAR